jgi:predicted AAA+ superfamily ATPase
LDKDQDLQGFDSSFFDALKAAGINDMKKYVNNQNEAVKVERIYDSIPLQQANKSHKFQYSKIRSGARANQYETALDWLMAAGLTYKTNCVTEPEKPIRYFVDPDVFKLFGNDVGLLVHLLQIDFRDIMLDHLEQVKGYLAESYVTCELSAKGISLYYWRSQNNAEVDFLIQNEEGVIPIEVKAAQNVQSKSLGIYCQKYKPAYAIRISAKNFGFANGIKSLPLYAAFCL